MDIAKPNLKKKSDRRRLIFGASAALALALGAAAFTRFSFAMPAVDASSVWIDTVKRGDMLRDVRAQGTLVPLDVRWISASTDAVVVKVEALPGTSVHADTLLLTLTSPDVEDALRSAQSDVTAATARVAVRRSELRQDLLSQRAKLVQAQSNYESANIKAKVDADADKLRVIPRYQYQQELVALKQLDTLTDIEQQRYDVMKSDLNSQMGSALADLQQKQSNLLLQKRRFDSLHVVAGIDGVLQQMKVQEGQRVLSGANLAQVARPDVLIARLRVPETQAKDVSIGQPAEVDTYNGVVAGHVTRVDPAVVDGTVSIDVALTGPLPSGARPDLSIEGVVHIDKIPDTLSIGRLAQPKIGTAMSLFRVDPSGSTATRIQVRLGKVSADRTQILGGLKEGERVILSDSSQWQQFQQIRLK